MLKWHAILEKTSAMCNSLHIIGNTQALLRLRLNARNPALDKAFRGQHVHSPARPLPSEVAYFPSRTSLAIVANCILDVPS